MAANSSVKLGMIWLALLLPITRGVEITSLGMTSSTGACTRVVCELLFSEYSCWLDYNQEIFKISCTCEDDPVQDNQLILNGRHPIQNEGIVLAKSCNNDKHLQLLWLFQILRTSPLSSTLISWSTPSMVSH